MGFGVNGYDPGGSAAVRMARKLRLEAEEGIYHVLNRGIYPADIFRAESTKTAFLRRG